MLSKRELGNPGEPASHLRECANLRVGARLAAAGGQARSSDNAPFSVTGYDAAEAAASGRRPDPETQPES
jgi:hypothetical protein